MGKGHKETFHGIGHTDANKHLKRRSASLCIGGRKIKTTDYYTDIRTYLSKWLKEKLVMIIRRRGEHTEQQGPF